MSTGRLELANSILNTQGSFTIPMLVDKSGMSRQLVRYHIDKLLDSGYIIRAKNSYVLIDREGLISDIIENLGKKKRGIIAPTTLFPITKTEPLKSLVGKTLALKYVYPDDYLKVRRALISDIDQTIESLTNAKRELSERMMVNATAAKQFSDRGEIYSFHKTMVGEFGVEDITNDKTEWESGWTNLRAELAE